MIKFNIKQLTDIKELDQWYGAPFPEGCNAINLEEEPHWEVTVNDTCFLMYRLGVALNYAVLHGNDEPLFGEISDAIIYCLENASTLMWEHQKETLQKLAKEHIFKCVCGSVPALITSELGYCVACKRCGARSSAGDRTGTIAQQVEKTRNHWNHMTRRF